MKDAKKPGFPRWVPFHSSQNETKQTSQKNKTDSHGYTCMCIYMYVTCLATVIISVFGEGNLDSLPFSVPHPALSVDLVLWIL